uniref:uncharacterized protein phf11 isoform X4 n=1 Tax=Scatophagus argus TaxID=75038 RepID=UPI001ED7EEBC|nr:uncharacterized protein phf11 isoform X4 [Scatophagus argus]
MAPLKRHAYEAHFKLQAISHAVQHGNRAAAREFNISESMVRKWRKQEDDLCRAKKTRKSFRGNKARWPQLEDKIEQWVIEQRTGGRSVSTVSIRLMATAVAHDMKINDFQGGPSWCFRFMKRRNLFVHRRTTISQQLLKEYEENRPVHWHQAPPFKRKSEDWNGIVTDDSSDPDANVPDTDIAIFGPIESDLEGSESQLIRRDGASPTGSTSGNQLENDSMKHEIKDEDETDAESESLLSPMMRSPETQSLSTTSAALPTQTVSTALALVKAEEVKKEESSPVHDTAGPSVPCQNSTGPPPSPVHSEPHGITSSAVSPAALETTSSPAAFPSQPEPGIDSTSFWRNCNAAGCTQAIFMDFINEMNSISSRIQSDQASQEDYDLALTVMEASGKLAELVTKQHTELQRKQMELQRAAAAMKKVVLPLRR